MLLGSELFMAMKQALVLPPNRESPDGWPKLPRRPLESNKTVLWTWQGCSSLSSQQPTPHPKEALLRYDFGGYALVPSDASTSPLVPNISRRFSGS